MEYSNLVDVKTKLLINGVNFDTSIRFMELKWKYRTEHLYQHDGGNKLDYPYPQEIILTSSSNIKVQVNLRYNPLSDWSLSFFPSSGYQIVNKSETYEVEISLAPNYYDYYIDDTSISSIAQSMGSDLVGVVPYNSCHLFGIKKECSFCEIVPSISENNFKYASKKDELIIKAIDLSIIDESINNLLLTSGNYKNNDLAPSRFAQILTKVQNQNRLNQIYSLALLMPPNNFQYIDLLFKSGFKGVSFNLEIWDEHNFKIQLPGKSIYGRDKMISALLYAKSIFGAENVFTNLVYGIQSYGNYPNLSKSENEMCLLATDKILDLGILPLFTMYHSTGKNKIGPLHLDDDTCISFYKDYAKKLFDSNIIPYNRNSILFNNTSVANHPYNDYYNLYKSSQLS